MIIGHIGARKGSKGVIRKNYRLIAGKPLIDWSLDQLLECSLIDSVIVSTDDEDLHEHAIKKGALDIGIRPDYLATDSAAKWNVWQHSLACAEDEFGHVAAFVDLDCTAPLRNIEDIINAIGLFQSQKPDMVMSCCEARKNPYFNLVELADDGSLYVSKPMHDVVVSRQQAPLVYEHAASTYVVSPTYLKQSNSLFDGRVIPFEMPVDRCLDIDSELDFKIVEFLLKEKIYMSISLTDKTIFITGAGGVLGRQYIRSMIDAGSFVIASDLPGPAETRLKESFGKSDQFHFEPLDVSDEKQVEGVFLSLREKGFEPNVILNNAAITGEMLMNAGHGFPDFGNTSIEQWEKTLRVNLTGAFLVARQMDRDIVGKYPAQLINVASMYALKGPHHDIYEDMPFKSFSAYSATKAGIHGLTIWLAGYWASKNCTVNTIAPGAVFNGHSEEFKRRISELLMIGRMAEPEEISNVMLFLCSDNAKYMTGQLVNVDGGFSAW